MTHNPAEALREALEPFAKAASGWVAFNDAEKLEWLTRLTVKDLRRAAEAIAALSSPAPAGGEVLTDAVVIWSEEHRAYWRPGAAGYTHHIEKAGRYTLADAKSHTSHCGPEKGIRIRPAPLSVTPPPSPDVAGVVEEIIAVVARWQHLQDMKLVCWALVPEELALYKKAATLLESLSAEKGRLVDLVKDLDDALCAAQEKLQGNPLVLKWVIEIIGDARARARTALTPKEKA